MNNEAAYLKAHNTPRPPHSIFGQRRCLECGHLSRWAMSITSYKVGDHMQSGGFTHYCPACDKRSMCVVTELHKDRQGTPGHYEPRQIN